MTAQILKEKLVSSATALGWDATDVPDFTAPHFRGRSDDIKPGLPKNAMGMRLGDYPVLIADIALRSVTEMQEGVRKLHSQMVIARSYMKPEEVINSHILLCATEGTEPAVWRQIVDLVERDETVCRKIVWIPKKGELEASYSEFIARTFLAMPWAASGTTLNAPLDHNQNLVHRKLVENGLSPGAAEDWISLVDQYADNPDALVAEMVRTRGQA